VTLEDGAVRSIGSWGRKMRRCVSARTRSTAIAGPTPTSGSAPGARHSWNLEQQTAATDWSGAPAHRLFRHAV